MTGLFRNAGLRPRLLGLMALLMIPVAAGGVWFAGVVRERSLDAIETAREHLAADFNNRARLVLRSSARALLATVAAASRAQSPAVCEAALRTALEASAVWQSIAYAPASGSGCAAATRGETAPLDGPALAGDGLDRMSADAAGPAPVARYTALDQAGASHLVVRIDIPAAGGGIDRVALFIDPRAVANSFEFGDVEDATIGLVAADGRVLTLRGRAASGDVWLPKTGRKAVAYTRFDDVDASGRPGVYAIAPVAFSDLAILARFSDIAAEQAQRGWIAMAVAPVGVALALFLLYALLLQRDVIRWIDAIRAVSRARLEDPASRARAPVEPAMPRELRNVATAFNAMLDDARAREQELERTVEENRFLMRELHHRVKNSLQVIQSFLSLSQREADAEARGELSQTEARVLVLSVAYRLALTDGGMRPVALRAFAEEIVANLAATQRRRDQWVSLDAETDARLVVDRAIPFGLAIVELVMSALAAPDCTRVAVTLSAVEGGALELIIGADGAAPPRASTRIMQGLALQLQALAQPLERDQRLRWRFTA